MFTYTQTHIHKHIHTNTYTHSLGTSDKSNEKSQTRNILSDFFKWFFSYFKIFIKTFENLMIATKTASRWIYSLATRSCLLHQGRVSQSTKTQGATIASYRASCSEHGQRHSLCRHLAGQWHPEMLWFLGSLTVFTTEVF